MSASRRSRASPSCPLATRCDEATISASGILQQPRHVPDGSSEGENVDHRRIAVERDNVPSPVRDLSCHGESLCSGISRPPALFAGDGMSAHEARDVRNDLGRVLAASKG
jgi:hypothetical protein